MAEIKLIERTCDLCGKKQVVERKLSHEWRVTVPVDATYVFQPSARDVGIVACDLDLCEECLDRVTTLQVIKTMDGTSGKVVWCGLRDDDPPRPFPHNEWMDLDTKVTPDGRVIR